jgi:penicillin-binding protein 1A
MRWTRFARHATLIAAFAAAAVLGVVAGTLLVFASDLPQISALDDYAPSTITRVLAADGEVLGEFATQRRLVISYDQISPLLRQAIVAAEDDEFNSHIGFSITRIVVTLARDIIERKKAGASTLTQQLARKLFLTDEKTWERKVKEAILAIQIEKRYTKNEIITLYCNQIPWGHGTYGAEAAARLYFGKSAKDVTLEEAATLAGIIQAPARQSPYVSIENATRRRNYALGRMAEVGLITRERAEAARKTPILTAGRPSLDAEAPFFVEEVRQDLEERYGAKQLYENGLSVYTTLDLNLQRAAERALADGLAALVKRRGFTQRPPELDGAVLAIQNRTGRILAMVGGTSFERSRFNRATQAFRQLGSTFKPIVFAAAIDRGLTPTSILDDSPVSFPLGPNQRPYAPENYDRQFEGPITLRRAIEQSRNVPTVRLMEQIGPSQVITYAQRLGFSSPVQPYLSSALGSSEATLLEVTRAFAVFPNQGVRMKPLDVLRVTDRQGNVLEENRPEPSEAIRADTAFVLTNLLRGVVQRGTAAQAASLNWPLGGKTGTTDDFSDAWFVGFDPDLTIGVWVGYDKKRALGPGESGSVAALPIWIDVMKAWIAKAKEKPEFAPPSNIVFLTVDRSTGVRVDDGSPGSLHEAFISGTQPGLDFR